MERQLTERLRVVRLVEVYGRLLTSRQLRLLRMYYLDDLSLGEAADQVDVTRQAVFDSLKRSVDELNRLEGTLHLLAMIEDDSRQKELLAERLDALERTIAGLDGQVDQTTLIKMADEIAALRRACR
ncbi:MAG: DNA-binding protein [bacterium]